MVSVPNPAPDPPGTRSLPAVLSVLGDPDLRLELLSSNPAGVLLVEASAKLPVVYCNESFQRWAPLGRQPAAGQPVVELFAVADRTAIRDSYQEAIVTGMPVHRRSLLYRRRAGAGRRADTGRCSVSHYPVRGPAAKVTHVLSFVIEVARDTDGRPELRQAQERVLGALGGVARHLTGDADWREMFAELTATIGDLVSASRVAFWRYDAATRTATLQPGAFGFTDEELASVRGFPFRPGGAGPLSAPDTLWVPWKTGDQLLGALGASGAVRPGGFTDEDVWVLQVAAAAAALVLEHREADEELARLREREAATLQRQIEQSIQLEQLKADFLKLASHELRGPLAVVRGYVSMMEDGTLGPVGDQVAPALPLLRAKLDDMNQLINEMLETARLEDSALQLHRTRLDLREVVHEAVRGLDLLMDERHRLQVAMPDRPVPVIGDQSRLMMIVSNLVHNAIKYSPRGGDVVVRCKVEGTDARVSVTDQGIGIAGADRGRLFTRFGRILTKETSDVAGTGLGLYLARDLARRHGGDIDAESEPGVGSTFTLTLPLARER